MDFPHFTIIAGPDKGKLLPVHPGSGHLLGRHSGAAYTLNDPRISRFHCAISSENGTVSVSDQGGSGGTLVNGVKITSVVLRHADTIQIGDTVLRFLTEPFAEANTVAGLSKQVEYDPAGTDELAQLTGRTLAHFRIGQAIGKGSTGMVFRAVDTDSGDTVALKIMQPAFARNEEDVQRFVRAMQALLPLRHPNLVDVLGAGKSGPYCWSALELVEGESLTEVIRRIGVAGMLDWKYAFRVGVHLGRALSYAHGHGIIHRDIAPANVLVRASDKLVKLGDLMLAKALEGTLARQITRPGELVGDVNYMSPERTAGGGAVVDHRSDLFGLGATCYALLCGKPPFAGTSLVETITRIRTAEPVKPSNFQLGIPSTFEGAVIKLLAKRPEERYQSADELLADLDRVAKTTGVAV
jgi:serine/threonine protein kinase